MRKRRREEEGGGDNMEKEEFAQNPVSGKWDCFLLLLLEQPEHTQPQGEEG